MNSGFTHAHASIGQLERLPLELPRSSISCSLAISESNPEGSLTLGAAGIYKKTQTIFLYRLTSFPTTGITKLRSKFTVFRPTQLGFGFFAIYL